MECKRVDLWFIVGYLCEKWMLQHGICKVVLGNVSVFCARFFERFFLNTYCLMLGLFVLQL